MPWQKDKQQVCYQGRDSKRNGLWGVIRTYGGMLAENVVQAGSRDLMVDAMFRVEEARYPIILTVHDEIVSEIPVDFGSLEEYEELMSVVPAWAKGCPVGVDGWRGDRYRK
jgi:DNA polymerase